MPDPLERTKRLAEAQAAKTRDAELALRLNAVTTWHERSETRPGASAKDEEQRQQL